MSSHAKGIVKIEQVDNYRFKIEWNDGITHTFLLSDVQKQCPCAACVDEKTGKKVLDPSTIPYDVKASKISNVGRYALRVFFTSGCKNGIFSFDHLYQLGNTQC
jgi:ATP-binding protein involved in chromosome partitioning